MLPRGWFSLIVEDDATVRRLARACLARLGYRTLEAANGVEALRVWEGHQGEIDLLLTDLVMPEGMSGRDLAERLRLARPGLPVIFSTGYSRDIVAGDPDFAAREQHLPKPYDPSTLAQAVRCCLDARQAAPAAGQKAAAER